MQYAVVQHGNIKGLNKLVNKALQEGWELQGGVAVNYVVYSGNSKSSVYCQAVTYNSENAISIDTGEGESDTIVKIQKEPTLMEKIAGTALVLGIIAAVVKYFF